MIEPLRLMTWNVRYFSQGTRGIRATEAHLHRTAWVLSALDPLPDVIGLQEIEDGSLRGGPAPQAERFGAALERALQANRRGRSYRLEYFPAHRYRLGSTAIYTTGLALLVRGDWTLEDPTSTDITEVRLAAFAKLKQRRIAARVRLRPPGWERAVTVCTTHLSLPAFFEVGPLAVPRRMGHGSNQLAEVARLCDALGPAGPAVVMGDFNSEPGSPAYAAMEARGWVPAPGSAPTASFLHHRMHLDHLFGAGVRWERARVVTEAEGLSDHLPKIAELTI